MLSLVGSQMRRLVKVNGVWRLFYSGNQERRFCTVCNHTSYNAKEFGCKAANKTRISSIAIGGGLLLLDKNKIWEDP
jgi:hypothetical protein